MKFDSECICGKLISVKEFSSGQCILNETCWNPHGACSDGEKGECWWRRAGQVPLGRSKNHVPLPLSSGGSCSRATGRPHIQLGCRFRLDFLSAAAPHSTCMKSKHLGLMWTEWISSLILLFVSVCTSMRVCEIIFLEYFIAFLNLSLALHPYNLFWYEIYSQ